MLYTVRYHKYCCVTVCWSQVTLITRPLNHVIKTGQTVVFRCELSQQSELGAEIEWFECITYDNGTCRYVSDLDRSVSDGTCRYVSDCDRSVSDNNTSDY